MNQSVSFEASFQAHKALHEPVVMGKGEMADLVRCFDWPRTSFGPIETWSKELLSILNVVLSSPLPCFIYWGADFLVLYNDASLHVPGLRHPDALGSPAREVWREAWHVLGPELEQVLSGGESLRHEATLVPLETNGRIEDFYWDYACSPIFEGDKAGGVLVICRDITEAVRAANRLRESEAQARRILHSISDAVIVTDIDTRITVMNSAAEELTGWRLAQASGRRLNDVFHLVHETTRELAESPADKVKRLGRADGPIRAVLVARDGTEHDVASSGAPIYGGDGKEGSVNGEGGMMTGVVLVSRNINERRKIEREREIFALRLDEILDATTDAVAILDRNWRFTYVNRHAMEILQHAGELIGKDVWESLPNMACPDSPFVLHYRRAMDEGLPGEFDAEYVAPLNLSLHVSVKPSSDGIIIFFRDVTEQKRRDATLMQTEKLAAVGRMASSIAHEINNPLEAVTNLLYLARNSTQVEEIHPLLDTADEELRRVANMVNQTLRFHRQVTKPQAIDCTHLVSGVLNMYQSRLRSTGVSVEARRGTAKSFMGYEGDIRQVLNNIVGNAIDAMPDGGRLVVGSHEGTDWRSERRGVLLSVADTGAGMDAKTMSRIYEAFFTTKGMGGTGLGLWVSAQIMERHKGRIRIRSCRREGRNGTVIMLFFPFDEINARPEAQN